MEVDNHQSQTQIDQAIGSLYQVDQQVSHCASLNSYRVDDTMQMDVMEVIQPLLEIDQQVDTTKNRSSRGSTTDTTTVEQIGATHWLPDVIADLYRIYLQMDGCAAVVHERDDLEAIFDLHTIDLEVDGGERNQIIMTCVASRRKTTGRSTK